MIRLRQFLEILAGIVLAIVLFAAFSSISVHLIQVINVFSLVVIYFASTEGEVKGALLGTVCGLIQDSMSLGVFGVAGLAKTIIGFAAGFVAKRINVGPWLRNFIFIFVLISMELILWSSLYSFIYSKSFNTGRGLVFLQPLITALVGSSLFPSIRRIVSSLSDRQR